MNISVSASAVNSAMERFNDAAIRVGQGPVTPGFAANVVDLKVAQSEVEAAVELLRTESEILGYLIDELV